MEDLKRDTISCDNGNLLSDWKRINSAVVGFFTITILIFYLLSIITTVRLLLRWLLSWLLLLLFF